MRFRKIAPAFVVCALTAQDKLPDGPGRDVVQKVCTPCHEIDTVFGTRRTRIAWERSVERMISHGAKGSDDEFAAVIEYLTKNFGRVNVNTASAGDLEKALSIPAKEAEAILGYREKNGRIGDFEELKNVPGVDGEQLREKRSLIAFSQ